MGVDEPHRLLVLKVRARVRELRGPRPIGRSERPAACVWPMPPYADRGGLWPHEALWFQRAVEGVFNTASDAQDVNVNLPPLECNVFYQQPHILESVVTF